MSRLLVTGSFAAREQAEAAATRIRSLGYSPLIHKGEMVEASDKETRFIGRIFLVVVAWSIVGTAAGATLGLILHATIGPPGTEGLIIQVVTWAIFAHLIIGMWAGYLLLADRTEEDLPAVRENAARIELECDSIDDARRLAAELQAAGAENIVTTEAMTTAAG
jgi:hypothetical protein